MENLEKLPEWAQALIRQLDSKVQTLEETLARRNGEVTEGRIIVNPYDTAERLVFADHSSVRFAIAEPSWRDYFEVRLKGDHIEVSAGGPMSIRPHVTNVISLRLVD